MAHSRNFITGSVALLLITASGCAGNGMRNMFSRNETEGYKTLEELEAEEAAAAERDAAVADAEGPRFAPWLPFGKKSGEETDAIAAADTVSSDSVEESKASGWWKNPFRNRDDAALDPFLAQDDSQNASAAKNEKTPERSALPVAANDEAELFSADESLRTVSDTRETAALPNEDQLLAEKFEKHFRQNTVAAAAESEHVEPLIVAGKTTKNDNQASESGSTEKLLELERLLADRRSSARKSAAKASPFGEESPDLAQASDDFFKRAQDLESGAHPQPALARNRASQAVESFDNLLAGTPSSAVSAHEPLTTSNRGRFDRNGTHAATDINVANTDWMFSNPAKNSSPKDARTSSPEVTSGGWSGRANSNSVQSAQSEDYSSTGSSERDGRVVKPGPDQLAMNFAAGRDRESIPSPTVPDSPDTNFSFPESALVQTPGNRAIPGANVMHRVSASRELPATAASDDLTDDSFFTDAASASTLNGTAAEANAIGEPIEDQESAAGRGSLTSIKGRHWLLLFCGAIVVLLLFAPGRKKPLQANHA